MTETTLLINTIIAGAGLAIDGGLLFSIPFRIKRHGSEALKNHERSFWFREIAIFVSAIVIPVLCIFIHFEIVPTVCLCCCSVMGTWVGIQELFPKKNSEEK